MYVARCKHCSVTAHRHGFHGDVQFMHEYVFKTVV